MAVSSTGSANISGYCSTKINLSLKSGVPLVPSHNAQPMGMVANEPLHIQITPVGKGESEDHPVEIPVVLNCNVLEVELYLIEPSSCVLGGTGED